MLNIEEIRKELGNYALKDEDCISYSIRAWVEKWATNHFGRLPYLNQLTDRIFDKIDPSNIEDYDEDDKLPVYDDDCTAEELREKHQNIDVEKTLINILKAYPETIEYYYRADKIQNAILFNEEFVYCDGVFYMDVPTIPQKMYDCVVEKENKPKIRWILRDSRGSILNKYMTISTLSMIEFKN